jgi:sugar O-acyltransferase (sialic acid O-acetyltransferase NeuD family)
MKVGVIIGYSGHAYVVLDNLIVNNYQISVYCEQVEMSFNPYKLHYAGKETDPEVLNYLKDKDVFIGIGDNKIRSTIYSGLAQSNISMPMIKHPGTIVSSSAKIADAVVIMAGVIINPLAEIGIGVICNTASVIEHECKIGDFSHIAPGAVLAGSVTVGSASFIGANAVIRQGINVGNNVIVGAGSVVIKDIPDNSIVFGNPSKNSLNG